LVAEALDLNFFKAVDLYGAEMLKPISDFKEYFDIARAKNLRIKIHSGETGDPLRVGEEFNAVRPHAIQHGVRASEDLRVLEQIARSGIEVNVCPWSNYCLRVVERYEDHPIRKMFDAGVKVTVNSDDLAVFGLGVSEEYVKLYSSGVFKAHELEQIRVNGINADRTAQDQ